MAAKNDPTRIRIDNIKADLRSISTCTSATAVELQALLAGKGDEPVQKENRTAKSAASVIVQSSGRRRAGVATVTASLKTVKQPSTSLSPRERYIVATEIANITLKSLADALKTSPPPQLPRPSSKPISTEKDARKAPKQHTGHAKDLTVSSPLQERSSSQTTISPTKPLLRRSSSCSSSSAVRAETGLVATAECATIAFRYLGTTEAAKTAGKDTPGLQYENGLLALIGKLVTHGLDNLAVKELRVLKRRLDNYLGIVTAPQGDLPAKGKAIPKSALPREKESVASLLDFPTLDQTSPALPIITSHQIYALRVISRLRRPRIVEATWEYLKLSSPSSPANLISHIATSPDARLKATRQLETLAQTILQLCPSISSSADNNQSEASPDVVLQLQHLTFKIRQRWWALAKHQGDEEKELIEPFSKCIIAFSRRSQMPPRMKFKLAESLYVDILGLEEDSVASKRTGLPSFILAAKMLGSLAQTGGLTQEALRWIGLTQPQSSISNSAAGNANQLVRIATISLEASTKGSTHPGSDESIASALDALSGSLGGSATQLDSLFIEVNALRRVATRIFATNVSITTMDHPTKSLQKQSFRIISACVHFSARFVKTGLPDDSDAERQPRYHERVIMVSKMLKSIVDSVLACCRQRLSLERDWMEIDTLIQDCLCVLQNVEQHIKDDILFGSLYPKDGYSPFVKLSNAYWAIYLHMRKAKGDPELFTKAIQRSIELLRTRTQGEKQSGLLPMKFEKLGETLDDMGQTEGSRRAFLNSTEEHVKGDALQMMLDLVVKHPIYQIFDGHSPLATLGRVLKSYHRSIFKSNMPDFVGLAFFDDTDLPPAVRGALLEWQLAMYLKTLSRNRSVDSGIQASVQEIVKRLLVLYTPAEYPIRRQRVFVMILQLAQSQLDALSDGTRLAAIEVDREMDISRSQDRDLSQFGANLTVLLKLKSSMQESIPPITVIQECFSMWQTLVESTSSWDGLTKQIDNPEPWIQEMQAVADYLLAKGEEYVCIPVLHLLGKVLELEKSGDVSRLVSTLCALGLQFLRLGYSGKAGFAFAKAETLVDNSTSTETKLRWHLNYAEYLLQIGNSIKCQKILLTAETIAQGDTQFMDLTKQSTSLSGRMRFNRILADACYVYSLLSTSNGHHRDAARYAKQCVALNRRVWAALESKSTSQRAIPSTSNESDSTFDPLSSMRNEKGMPLVMAVTHDALKGADFWSLIPSLYRGLMQQSVIFAHQGLLHEAVYVAEQADKVVSALDSRSLSIENASYRAEYWAESGRPDKAQPILEKITQSASCKHLSMASYHSAMAKIHHSTRDYDKELAAYETVEKLLDSLTLPSTVRALDTFSSTDTEVNSLAEQMSAVSLETAEPESKKPARTTRGRKPVARAVSKVAPKSAPRTATKRNPKAASSTVSHSVQKRSESPPSTASIAAECSLLYNLQVDVVRKKALSALSQEDVLKALQFLDHAQSMQPSHERNPMHLWTRFKVLLSQSMQELAKDFTLNTLPDSTIAFPSMAKKDRSPSAGAGDSVNRSAIVAPTTKSKGKRSTKDDVLANLYEARECLTHAHSLLANGGSRHNFQLACFALGHLTVVLSAVSGGDLHGSLHPLYAAYMSEIPKCNSLRLAQESINVECENMSREEYMKWPELRPSNSVTLATATEFQETYVDVIPKSWTAISLALSEAHDELFITRYDNGNSPFVLRLPMARHTSRDMDEEEFTFEDGRRDFDEIIELSDFSTRSAKDVTSREAKVQWWTEREALDTRLHELLINIENIWLGGFKGIFSQHPRQPALLARFRKSLNAILDRHLPSRSGRKQEKRVMLDARVLDLFVGLGDASHEELDLDEALMDLLYFVVDILQFNGERNAYDEIDFDAMVIETLDALRAYHGASTGVSSQTRHTILILDKNLHGFPWESLPSLEKLSISRLPSLAALRERILAARPSSGTAESLPGHYISGMSGGTSILNPSGDLSNTLKTLKPRLDEMQGDWTHIANRAPTETEFESSLKEKDLVLYFGHGSGAQFIKSKSVRRLYPGTQVEDESRPGCATTLLFGCSSAHLTENGIYEPSGMLASYLTAGAPAVLGMLWDVTDKDCDRFAVKAGELWGLWPESTADAEVEAPKTAKKSKGKGKVAQLVDEVESARGSSDGKKKRRDRGQAVDEQTLDAAVKRRRGVGLDEAVRAARDACVLRYLNGAAAVVYGIPVFLD
ncbi:peptidase family C50-domain-containing protein [Massariosphaeria phaeospora]|uniref:separase n=1 Tax=Massariosphaeria phaeospora TaxID=100035 RepID=A0A7C8MA87_9PLEO|nr:peptidase family C50-domain-containing protein [Massariosphaeria phaeospora]